jgi:hypothetical protein
MVTRAVILTIPLPRAKWTPDLVEKSNRIDQTVLCPGGRHAFYTTGVSTPVKAPASLVTTVAAELERERPLPARVLNYIGQTYGIDHDAIGRFLADRLPELEEYEVDLILSPVFTPKLTDQAICAELLGRLSIPLQDWPALIDQLVRRPTRAQLVDDAGTHTVTLQEVTVKRYIDRLRLDGTISEAVSHLIDQTPSGGDRPMLKAIARRTVWESSARNKILAGYLTAALDQGSYSLADVVELLNVVETVKPVDAAALMEWIPRRKDILREQINSGTKQFFSQNIQELHGGDRDQRSDTDPRMSAKESEFAFLTRLWQLLSVARQFSG